MKPQRANAGRQQPPNDWPEEPQHKTLNQLFSPGTILKEVPPDFEGLPLKLYLKLAYEKQAQEYAVIRTTLPEPPLRRLWTKRDDYGKKSA